MKCPDCGKKLKMKPFGKHESIMLDEVDWRELIGDKKVDKLLLKEHKKECKVKK
jgi:hypothetical protein